MIAYQNIFKALVLRRRIPLTLSFVLTNRCNQRCAYCRVWEHSFKELDTESIIKLIDDYKKKGTIWISFMGGEPLLRDDLGIIIAHTLKNNIKVSVSSNGILVPERINDLLGIQRLKLSLDGEAAVHDSLRGKGTFLKVLKAAETCKQRSIPIIFDCTLSRHNLDQIHFLVNTAKDFGAVLNFQPVTTKLLWAKEDNPLTPEVDIYKETIKRIMELKKKGAPILNSMSGLKHLYFWPNPKSIFCCAEKFHLAIEPDGTNIGCNRAFHNLIRELGDTNDTELLYNCCECWCASVVEFNLMFSFNPDAILNCMKYAQPGLLTRS